MLFRYHPYAAACAERGGLVGNVGHYHGPRLGAPGAPDIYAFQGIVDASAATSAGVGSGGVGSGKGKALDLALVLPPAVLGQGPDSGTSRARRGGARGLVVCIELLGHAPMQPAASELLAGSAAGSAAAASAGKDKSKGMALAGSEAPPAKRAKAE